VPNGVLAIIIAGFEMMSQKKLNSFQIIMMKAKSQLQLSNYSLFYLQVLFSNGRILIICAHEMVFSFPNAHWLL